jgi:hypothetical protein
MGARPAMEMLWLQSSNDTALKRICPTMSPPSSATMEIKGAPLFLKASMRFASAAVSKACRLTVLIFWMSSGFSDLTIKLTPIHHFLFLIDRRGCSGQIYLGYDSNARQLPPLKRAV